MTPCGWGGECDQLFCVCALFMCDWYLCVCGAELEASGGWVESGVRAGISRRRQGLNRVHESTILKFRGHRASEWVE